MNIHKIYWQPYEQPGVARIVWTELVVSILVLLMAGMVANPPALQAQDVGDFYLEERTSTSGAHVTRSWPKGAGTLWGTGSDSKPIKITVGSGLTLNTSTKTLSLTGGGVIDGANITAGTVANAALANSSITIAGTNVALGQSITATTILDSISSTRGAILYRGASGWVALAPGTNGYVLTSNGTGADPTYQAAGGSSGLTIGTTSISSGTSGRLICNNGGVVGELTGITLTAGAVSAATITQSALGTTTAAGATLVNSTAAANGAQQVSPMLLLQGSGWKTTSTAASQTVAMGLYALPVQGTSAPTGELVFAQSINGGAAQTLAKITRDASVVAFKINNGITDLGVAQYAISGGLTINPDRYVFTVGGVMNMQDDRIKLGYLNNLILTNGAYTSAGVACLQVGEDLNGDAIDQEIKAADGITGTNRNGADLTFSSGDSTGSGTSALILRTPAAGSSGTAARTAAERMRITSSLISTQTPFKINGSSQISGVFIGSPSLDFPNIGNGATADLTAGVTGVSGGDAVFVAGSNSSMTAGVVLQAWCSAADEVTVRVLNLTGADLDLSESVFSLVIIKP